ncbi:MAG TPA: RNA polymerase factor sigma-54 [Bacteroidales bacterium]|nr:RNA polymerase factor sigma-54 [Bacteroidales bacterium]
MLKQSLQQKQLQKLSPQQINMIKLLELPTLQLEQRIKKELEENPALEEDDNNFDEQEDNLLDQDNESDKKDKDDEEFSIEDYMEDDETPAYRLKSNNYSKDDERKEIPYSIGDSFHENLIRQIGLKSISEKEKNLALFIIGNIDEDGYLRREIESIVDDLAFTQNIQTSKEELNDILKIIQDLDPAGVGARNLRECLILQLKRKETRSVESITALEILNNYFEEFTKKHYTKIITKLEITEAQLKGALEVIIKLNPKPGSSHEGSSSGTAQAIIPDFILENNDGKLELSLNSRNAPELRLSKTYSQMLEDISNNNAEASRSNKDAIVFIKQKLDSAKWFIDAVKQRQNTLMITMNAIVEYQKEYFTEGDETLLKPMILKDIAEITNLDISTISRVANSKYVQTPFGNFLLKYFFSEGMQTDSGEEVSTREIKKIMMNCISEENKKKPLTDEKLSEILKEKGYNIARRTVAKYREQLEIPVARLRKEL